VRARRFWYWLGAIALAGLAVRLVYIWHWRREPTALIVLRDNDAAYYHRASRLLADGHGFLNPFFSAPGRPYQSADHPPVYQLFLAGFARLGLDGATDQLVLTATFLGTPTVALSGLAGRALRSDRVGLLAAALVAVAPNVWSWDGMLLSESAAMFAVTLTLWAAYRHVRSPSRSAALVLGGSASLAAMSRAELVLLLPLVALPMVWRRGDDAPRERWRRAGVVAAAAAVIIGPWVVYNLSRFEQRVYLSVGAEITLASATCDDTFYGSGTGYWSYFCAKEVRDSIRVEFPPTYVEVDGEQVEIPQLDQSQEARYFREAATDYLGDHLGRLPVVLVARWGRVLYLWNPTHIVNTDHGIEGRDRWVTRAGWLTFYPLAALAVAGAVSLRRARIPIYPILAVFATVFAAVTLAFGTPRYRASAETALCLLAAASLDAIWRRVRHRARVATPVA
jgi:hypothetical protein